MSLVNAGIRLTLLSLLITVSQFAVAQSPDEQVLTFGIVPQQAVEKLATQWIPMIEHLSAQTGLPIQFATAPNIPEFEKRLAEGVYDLAYMNPHHFTVFNEAPGYRAFARQRDHEIKGIIVVATNSGIDTVDDLAGKKLAFPAPNAFAATLITRAYLDAVAPGYTATFVNSHDSVYRSVDEGFFDAGGGIQRTLGEMDPGIRGRLNILWTSPGYTGHAFAAHPEVSLEVTDQLANAMINMGSTANGQALLRSLGMSGFQAATDADWDDVRALGLH